MRKIHFLFFLLFLNSILSAQGILPTMKANSDTLDIRIGDDLYLEKAWYLNPKAQPDIYRIGSKSWYKEMPVSFISDIDSISIQVQAGNSYDFIVLSNQNIPCPIRIVTVAHPFLFSVKNLFPILFGIIVLLFLLYRKKVLSLRFLLRLGIVCSILFWLITFIAGFIQENYVHYRHTISELGLLESRAEIFTAIALLFLSLLGILFCIGFYRVSKKYKVSTLPALLNFSFPISMLWAAIFPLGNEFHHLIGPLPLLTIFAALLAFLLWRKQPGFQKISRLSLLCCIIMLFLFLRFIQPFGFEYEGLVQRFFYLGSTLWWGILSSYFIKRGNEST